MAWTIEIEDAALRQIGKLGRVEAKRILTFLKDRVGALEDPRHLGKALQGSTLGDYWSYRVGDYRVVCELLYERLVVSVVRVANRREVYR